MKKRTKLIFAIVLGLIVLLFAFAKMNRIAPLSWGHYQVNQAMFSKVAINSYDPVAYYTENKATMGQEKFMHTWNDADWHFASQENMQLFTENPEKYAPKYGGYCAFAISKGFTANTSSETFEIIDNDLFLFADQDVKDEWMKDRQSNFEKCEENWN